MTKTQNLDPDNLRGRTYKQMARLLDMMEEEDNASEMTIPQLIAAIKVLIEYDFKMMRKTDDDNEYGSAVRKFSTAFQTATNEPRGRARRARPGAAAVAAEDDTAESDES